MDHSAKSNSLKNAWIIFFLSASFYLYEFILQVAPGVMAEPMMQTFHVGAQGFGVIAAFYFYAYAPMQLPAGLLFDRYGPRKLMTLALILCAFGSFFFASTDSIFTAAIGRFLIGVGSAFSFIGVLVLISRWFPAHYFAVLAGVAQLMSSIGAMFGEMPLALLIEYTNWRIASFILAFLGFILAAGIWKVVRDYPDGKDHNRVIQPISSEWKRLLTVCRNPHTWIIGAYACTVWTPIAVFAALWGVPYLQEKYHISLVAASGLCSAIWLGIGVGSPLLGWVSDRFESRKLALILSAFFGLTAALILLYVSNVSFLCMYIVLFMLGFGAGGQAVSFAVVKDNNSLEYVGTASGFNNLSVLIGAAIFQPLVGYMLSQWGTFYMDNGVPVYNIESYQKALMIMPLCYLISLLIAMIFLRESHPAKAKDWHAIHG